MMNRSEQAEIDRLVSEIADIGTSAECVERLDAILRNRRDLQEYYASTMALHMLLDFEFDLSMQQFQPVVPRAERSPRQNIAAVGDQCLALSTRIGRDAASLARKVRGRTYVWQAIAAAAVLTTLAVGYILWRTEDLQQPVPFVYSPAELHKPARDVHGQQDGLVVRDAQSLRVISRLTKTPSLTSLRLPQCPSNEPVGITLCRGTAWMEKAPMQRERGYVVAVAPGYQMDVFVYSDAAFQNGLSVVELDEEGHMTGSAISFSNLEKGKATAKSRVGCIGNYSEFNDRKTNKYYLLTGSHLPPHKLVEDSWHLSDFKVQYDSSDIMVIGWDDSGYIESDAGYLPDRDFNDLRAILRFSQPGAVPPSSSPVVSYSRETDNEPLLATSEITGYPIDVRPNEALVVLVSSSARLQNSIRVVDAPSRKILWHDDGPPIDASSIQDIDRGVFVIRNFSANVRRYEIQSQCARQTENGKLQWQDNPYQAFADGDQSIVVGFEDSVDETDNVDWNDIRVYARWLSD
jgi:hypothetical protein